MNMYSHFTLEDFHALSKLDRLGLSKSDMPVVISIDKAENELIDDIGHNALVWLKEKDRLALDCRRIVDGQKWNVPMLTSDFLPKILLLAPWRFKDQEFLHLFTYLSEDQFYHWDAVNLSYDEAYRLIFTHSVHFHCAAVSVTDFCNLKCRMCAFHSEDENYAFNSSRSKSRVKQQLGEEDYKAFIDELHPSTSLLFLGSGELFVSKKWEWYLRYAKNKGFRSRICTNGMLLTEDVARKLIELNVEEVIFSVDGHTKAIVEDIRLGCDFDLITKNIKSLMKVRDGSSCSDMLVNIHCCLNSETKLLKESIISYWNTFGIDTLVFCAERINWSRDSNARFTSGLDNVFRSFPCWNSLDTIGITTEGKIIPCFIHMQTEWSDRPMDWLLPVRPNGVKNSIKAYRRMRLDKGSPYYKGSCALCTENQMCYMLQDNQISSTESYRFGDKTSRGDSAIIKYLKRQE
ncbi:MAG: radical SAM protein [Chlorobium sp.]|jgi:hypothetical protein|nr:radical SAM protein [Chlorobium sp.]